MSAKDSHDEVKQLRQKIKELKSFQLAQEEKLRQVENEIELRVKERTAELLKAKREIELLNESLDNVFKNTLDGIIILDEHGCFKNFNPAAGQIIGKSLEQMAGKHISSITGGKAPYTMRMLSEGRTFSDIETMIDGENERNHFLLSGVPIKDEQGLLNGGVLFLRPIRKVQRLVNRFSGAHASFHFQNIIAQNEEMLETIRIATLAAASMGNILLEGESGSGKELFAQAIHNQSKQSREPFVALNCGAIPRELVSSELFGYTEGAFTGSRRGGNPGKFELASGGTLFLDEIGDMPLEQQSSLLRVLQEKSIIRIGGDMVIPVDVRVICATNKNLWREVGKGNFRQDLYYRLNVIYIKIPPLRERREDIPLLFQEFLRKLGKRKGDLYENVQAEVIDYMEHYSWPGNVRELENVVAKMLNLAGNSRLGVEHLPPDLFLSQAIKSEPDPLSPFQLPTVDEAREYGKKKRAEKEYNRITELLSRFDGNISRVAREMGLARSTVYRKIKQYRIQN